MCIRDRLCIGAYFDGVYIGLSMTTVLIWLLFWVRCWQTVCNKPMEYRCAVSYTHLDVYKRQYLRLHLSSILL